MEVVKRKKKKKLKKELAQFLNARNYIQAF